MLSLLTLSFAISTLPSSIFYTMFRSKLADKPYRRLVTNSFILLRHLSHSFNFIIYFTSSSIIKQQLKETISEVKRRDYVRYLKVVCCCIVYIFPSSLKRSKQKSQKRSSSDYSVRLRRHSQRLNKKDNDDSSSLALNYYPYNSRYERNDSEASYNDLTIIDKENILLSKHTNLDVLQPNTKLESITFDVSNF